MQNDEESDENVRARFDFYRDVSLWCVRIVFVMAIWAAGDVWKDVYVAMHPSGPNVVGLTPDGRLQNAVVLSQPIIDDIAMKAWAEQAVLKTCNLNFMNWEAQLNEAADNLLPAAVDGLIAEMKSKNITKELKSDRLLEWCSLGGASWIAKKDWVNNALYYEIKMPLLVRFMGQSEVRDRLSRQTVRVIVLQVDPSVKPRGFGIAAIQAEPEKPAVDGG